MKKHKIIELLTLLTGILLCIMGSMSIACDCNPPCGSCKTCNNGNCYCTSQCCKNSDCGICQKCSGCSCKPKCTAPCEECDANGNCYDLCELYPQYCLECGPEEFCISCGGDSNLSCCVAEPEGECYPWRCKTCVDGNIVDDCNAALCQTCDPNIGCVVCGGDANLACCEGECYDRSLQRCCVDAGYYLCDINEGCCGGECYNYLEYHCCKDTNSPYVCENKECCMNGSCQLKCDPEGGDQCEYEELFEACAITNIDDPSCFYDDGQQTCAWKATTEAPRDANCTSCGPDCGLETDNCVVLAPWVCQNGLSPWPPFYDCYCVEAGGLINLIPSGTHYVCPSE